VQIGRLAPIAKTRRLSLVKMPSKRTNADGSSAAALPAKRSRAGAAPVAPVDAPRNPLQESCTPVLKMLRGSSAVKDFDGSEADLLCTALPLALKAVEGQQRHAYQEKMLDVIAAQLTGIVAKRAQVVASLEKEEAGLEADKARSTAVQEDITSRLSEKTKQRDEAAEATKKQQEVVNEAQTALEVARKAVEAADVEKLGLEKARDDFAAGLTELWEPLKNSEISGKQWREREKMLARLAENMKLAGIEPSLLAALPVALKIKMEARSPFAQITLTHAEELYLQHVEVMKQKVDSFGDEVSARAKALSDAEAARTAAQESLDAVLEADIAAQNAWLEVAIEDSDHKSKMESHGPAAAKVQDQLKLARAEVTDIREVFGSFEALRPVDAVLKKVAEISSPKEESAPADENMVTEATDAPMVAAQVEAVSEVAVEVGEVAEGVASDAMVDAPKSAEP